MLQDPEQLCALARSDDPAVRGKLTLAMADVCAGARLPDTDAGRLVRELLVELAPRVERDVRLRLAQKLSGVDWAPRELVAQLALDEISVAEPVLRHSLALLDDDLIRAADAGSTDHRTLIAGRPNVSEAVCDAAARRAEPQVLKTLLANQTATLSRSVFKICLDVAETDAALREPLARHLALPADVAEILVGLVEESLRLEIAGRFQLDPERLSTTVGAAARETRAEAAHDLPGPLIEDLAQAGRLTPKFLVKAAVQGRADLFDHGVAKLAGLSPDEVRVAIDTSGGWAAALACRACGVDRADYPAVHRGLADSGRLPRQLPTEAGRSGANAFVNISPAGAAAALRRLARMA